MAVKPRSDLHARIGRRVREIRLSRRLTQAALAERVDCSSHFVSGIERGVDSPSLLTLERIALALETTVEDLVADPPGNMSPAAYDLVRSLGRSAESSRLLSVLREVVALYGGREPEKRERSRRRKVRR